MNTWNSSGSEKCFQCQRPRPTHNPEENRKLRLPEDAHLWWECPNCSSADYRVNEAAKECPDCKAPRPANAISFVTPLYNPHSTTNTFRELGRKAKARLKKQAELEEARRVIRQQGQRLARRPQRTAQQTVDDWVTPDGDNVWAAWEASRPRHQEDESAPPWRRNPSAGALTAGRAVGHLAPIIMGTILCDMITPAEAAYAHETGVAAFAMMMLACVYQFLEGTKDVAAAVAENVVVMSDSTTATGIEQFEIAIPEIRRIAVATFAAIVIIFLWIISKELRKK